MAVRRFVVVPVVLAVLVVSAWFDPAAARQGAAVVEAAQSVPVRLQPAVSTLAPGGSVSVSVVADVPSGTSLESWTIDVAFSPAVVNVITCTPSVGEVQLCTPSSNHVALSGASLSGLTGSVTVGTIV